MKSIFVALAAALLLTACGGGSDDPIATRIIRYEVSGSASGARTVATYSSGSSILQKDVQLPASISAFASDGDFLQVSAQNPSASGSISVRIVVDGSTVRSATSQAGYGIASTSYRCCN